MDVKKMIDLNKFSAFLFDCDGTIADSMPVHLVAWNRVLKKWGASISLADHLMWAGRPTRKIVGLLNEQHGLNMDPDVVSNDKEAAYMDLIPTVQPIAYVAQVIAEFHGRVPFAVVSGSPRESVEKTLRHLQLFDKFDALVGAEDYAKGKPAPDCFLLGAQKLHVNPASCLVFEDADLGVEAARAAGMHWIRVSAAGADLSASHL
jgi:HAD superfamily hydrolase (TIGR01509 family)